MSLFTRNIEELLYLTKQKIRLVEHLIKNYKEGTHYIIEKNNHKIKTIKN